MTSNIHFWEELSPYTPEQMNKLSEDYVERLMKGRNCTREEAVSYLYYGKFEHSDEESKL